MKKILIPIVLFLLFSFSIMPIVVYGQKFDPKQGLVPCGKATDGSDACTIDDFFTMLALVYDFLVWKIASPLAILAITIGAVVLMTSAGNPAQAGTGKKILWAAIIGLVLVFLSWLIIKTILDAIGYTGAWNVF